MVTNELNEWTFAKKLLFVNERSVEVYDPSILLAGWVEAKPSQARPVRSVYQKCIKLRSHRVKSQEFRQCVATYTRARSPLKYLLVIINQFLMVVLSLIRARCS